MAQFFKIIVLICGITLIVSYRHVQSYHSYWFEKDHRKLNNYGDENSYYCDEKFLALENISKIMIL
jgi:hypothetical protein